MRELKEDEISKVSGGNPLVAGILGLAGSYYGGQTIGTSIYNTISDSFSMSTGEAAYYTVNGFSS